MLAKFSSVDGYCKNYASKAYKKSCNVMTIHEQRINVHRKKCIYTVPYNNTYIKEECKVVEFASRVSSSM